MASLKVHDKEFIPYISASEIDKEITRVASEINYDYKDKKPLFIAILNGAFVFAADLFKKNKCGGRNLFHKTGLI